MVSKRWLILVVAAVVAIAASGCMKGTQPKSDGGGLAGGVKPAAGAAGTTTSDRTITPDKNPAAGQIQPPATGAKWTGTAQDFEVTGFDGRKFKISDYAGQPVVLNFWAAWCGPCVSEFPDFQEVVNKQKGKFVLISVAVNAESNPEQFVKDKAYTWIFAHDTDGAKKYGVQAIPFTFFISPSGSIVDSVNNMMDINAFEQKLSKLLAAQ